MTFIQPSSKLLTVELKCTTVTILQGIIQSEETCLREQLFSLSSSNALNNVSSSTPVLLLPYNLPHHLEPNVISSCLDVDFIYSFYFVSLDQSLWKYNRLQRYSNTQEDKFQETFLPNYCSELGPKSSLLIEPKRLSHGYYLAVFTVSVSSNQADFRQFVQPIEIVRSDLQTKFTGNDTVTVEGQSIELDFYSSTIDPDGQESDRRKLNFTLLCYPERLQSAIFQPNLLHLGSTRPTEMNPQNLNPWAIQWSQLSPVTRRPELNVQFYEHQCFSESLPLRRNKEFIQFDPKTKLFNLTEDQLAFDNDTLHFLLIVRHVTDGRQLVARLILDKKTDINFENADLNLLEEAMSNLNDLASANPKKAVELVSGLADKLNEMSDNTVILF